MADEHNFLGIDLGTTNSVVSWGRVMRRTGMFEPEVLDIEQIGPGKKSMRDKLLPSVVYFDEISRTPFVGEYAKTDAFTTQPQLVVRSVKSKMGSGTAVQIGRKSFTPSYISSLVLNQIRAAIKDKFGTDVDDVVITVPASFDADMRADTIEAARQAGFKVNNPDGSPRDILLDEPRAALYNLINLQRLDEIPPSVIDLSTPKNILIFDLGGGTLDVSLHNVQADYDSLNVNVEDIAISRYTRIGGDNFDELLAIFFQKEFETKFKVLIDEIPEVHIQHEIKSKFLLEAESKKREINDKFKQGISQKATFEMLRNHTTVSVQIPNLYDNKAYWRNSFKWDEMDAIIAPLLGRDLSLNHVNRFEELTGDDANNIIYPILDVLHKAKHRTGDIPKIDAVFLNGGMTRFIPVQQRLKDFFGKEPLTILDPDISVAQGASIYHYSLHQGLKPKSAILAESYGIETNGGYVKHLVTAGTVLPMLKPIPINSLIIPEGTSQLTIPFYRGENKEPKFPNVKLLERVIQLPQACKQDELLNVEVFVDANKILTFAGRLASNPEVKIEITVQSTQTVQPDPALRLSKRANKVGFELPEEEESVLDVPDYVERLLNTSAAESTIKRGIELEILRAKNRSDFIEPIALGLQKISPSTMMHNSNASRRSILILGALGANYPNHSGAQKAFNVLVKICSQRIEGNSSSNEKYINQILPMGIVALGRLRNSAAESTLVQILQDKKINPSLKDGAIISLAKASRSFNALQAVSQFICGREVILRKASAWAVGKMGSRDIEPPLPVSQLSKALEDLLYQIDREQDSVTMQMITYAISELADQRNPSRREVFSGEYVSRSQAALERIQEKINAKAKTTEANPVLKKYVHMGLDMLYGKQLAQEQERVLLSLRSKLEDSEKLQ
jgi:molecular chaperone DnaK (HSP70)